MRTNKFSARAVSRLLVLAGCLSSASSFGQAGLDGPGNSSVIGAGTLGDMHGVASVNQAAGDNNQQANVRSLSTVQDGLALSGSRVDQLNGASRPLMPMRSGATRIEGDAFRNASGIVGVNQVAGEGNRQTNGFTLSSGENGEVLSDSALSGSLALTGVLGTRERPAGGERVVVVDDTAFRGVRGVVQLNQTAGSGNRSANNLGIRLSSASLN